MELKRTPLYETHVKLGGRMVDFGGWELPVQYTSVLEEHKAVRERAGLFDVSHMGEIYIEGKDAEACLNNLVTADIRTLKDLCCRYTTVCYENGTTVDDVLIYKYNTEKYLLVVNASNVDKDFAWFVAHKNGYDVEMRNESANFGQLALQGPRYMEVLQGLKIEGELPSKYYTFRPEVMVEGCKCIVSTTGYTGELGVEIYCKAEDTVKIHAAIMEAGKAVDMLPCGLGARDVLRFEAAMPLYGHELSDQITPREAGLDFTVKTATKESFIGREALIADPKRIRIGLKVVDKGVAREHCEVKFNGEVVGMTTSGSPAPALGAKVNCAMALVDAKVANESEFAIVVRGKDLKAERVELPFYKRK